MKHLKILLLAILLASFGLSASAQQVTVNLKQVKLVKVLDVLSEQTGYTFVDIPVTFQDMHLMNFTENNVIGKVFTPKYVLLSHILELSHTDPDSSRLTLKQGLTRASLLDCDNSYMPFWGEKLIWKDGALK